MNSAAANILILMSLILSSPTGAAENPAESSLGFGLISTEYRIAINDSGDVTVLRVDGQEWAVPPESLIHRLLHALDQEPTHETSAGTVASTVAGGGTVMVWETYDEDGDSWGLFGQHDGGLGDAPAQRFRVNQRTEGAQQAPALLALPDGGFVVAWESDVEGDRDIFARRFDGMGQAIGDDLRINLTTDGDQHSTRLVALESGLAVIWSDDEGALRVRLLGMDLIFMDDFESGGIDAWSSSSSPPALAFTVTIDDSGSDLLYLFDASPSVDIDGTITDLLWTFDDGSSAPGATASRAYPSNGDFSVTLTGTDNEGLQSQLSTVLEVRYPPIVVESTSPLDGEDNVALGRETVLRFSAPLESSTVTSAAIYAEEAGGISIPSRLHIAPNRQTVTVFYDSGLPEGTTVDVIIQGDLLLGERGQGFDGNGDGDYGGTGSTAFATADLTSVDGTVVCGRILASEPAQDALGQLVDVPLEGVTISVDGAEAIYHTVTDADGNYCLDPAPGSPFHIHYDGSTASNPLPEGAYYPFVTKSVEPVPGAWKNFGNAYLPLIVADTLQPVSESEDTVIELPASVVDGDPELGRVSLTVPADSLFADDGTRGGEVGLATVDPDRLPGELPAGLTFPLVVTVQTDGGTNFDLPAGMCFPNLPDPDTGLALEAGSKAALWSFNHDAATWEVVGAMTVSPDGLVICSDPGTGVQAPGWHSWRQGSQGSGDGGPDLLDCAACLLKSRSCLKSGAKAIGACAAAASLPVVTWGAFVPCWGLSAWAGASCGRAYDSCESCAGAGGLTAQAALTVGDTLDFIQATQPGLAGLSALVVESDAGGDLTQTQLDAITAQLDQIDLLAGGDYLDTAEGLAAGISFDPESAQAGLATGPAHFVALNDEGEILSRGLTEPSGSFSLTLRIASGGAEIIFFEPQSGHIGSTSLDTAIIGANLAFPDYLLGDASQEPDSDGDTLPDVAELVLGTRATISDTDGDGTSDGAEIAQGTNPLALDVQIGDLLEGSISVGGELDRYSFTAMAGQEVFFDIVSGASGSIDWRLEEAGGDVVFDRAFFGDRGIVVLETGGSYTLTVGDASSTHTGAYQVRLWDVPAPQQFSISIGDVVSDGAPGPGAGHIETPGVRDIYTFNATAGQEIFVDLQGHSGLSGMDWSLEDSEGTSIFSGCLGCTEPGVRLLTLGGTYTLTVGESDDDGTGTYQFQIWNVPAPQSFPISIGDVVSDGVPGPGAGHIETPGVRDIYTFNATAGQEIFVDLQGHSGLTGMDWKLEDSEGTVIFSGCLGCTEPGVRLLTLGGTYTLTVGENDNDDMGTYQFQIWNVPAPQSFSISIGDVVSDGVPGPGAGRIETPGVRDIYTFNATAGQEIFVDLQGHSGLTGLDWKLEDSEGTVIFNSCLGCSDPGAQVLTLGGTYTLTVGENDDDGTGTYQFQIWNGPVPGR